MKHIPFAWIAPGSALVVLASLLAGCQSPPTTPDVGAAVFAQTGFENAIIFQTVGEPIDVDDAVASTLTREAVVRLALRHEPDIQIRLARVRAALADAKQVRLLPNPVLNIVFRIPDGGGSANIEAGVSADLLTLLQTPRRTSAADNRLRVATADALTAVLDVIASVEQRFIAIQAADANRTVLADRQRLILRLLDLAKGRFDAGEASRLDLLSLDAERVAIEAEEIDANAAGTEHRLALARLIGQPSSEGDWTLPKFETTAGRLPTAKTLVETAIAHRPEVQSAQWNLAASGDDASLTRWSWFEGSSAGIEAERDGGWSVGPGGSLPIPIFDWGQARREKADAQTIEARHALTQISRQVVEDVRQAAAALTTARALFDKTQAELLPLAQRRYEQAETQYRAGEADITTFLQAEQQLLDAQSKRVDTQQRIALADSRLRRAVGGQIESTTQPATSPATLP